MIFSNTEFFVFFAVFFALYWPLHRQITARNALILLASYVFYGWWDPRFLTLIAVSTAVDWIAGFAVAGGRPRPRQVALASGFTVALAALLTLMGVQNIALIWAFVLGIAALLFGLSWATARMGKEARAKIFLWASVATNLGLLGVFKYFNFFADSFEAMVAPLGWQPGFVTLNVVLPVGISFYTFQTMSYTLDIRRGKLEPSDNFLTFATFVAFFPQLVAGPIERALNLLPQFEAPRRIQWDAVRSGAMLFLWGFWKKAVIADNLAPIADGVFADPGAQSSAMLMTGVLAFTFQIYCDFSGYSDMARGIARIMGFELMVNFNMPYFARTPSEFWQRWHISLSSWLRDYLYIPLGGNRGGALFTYRNLMLTMLLGGLWHGAAWTFVAWGAFHGAILVIYRLARADEALAARPADSPGGLVFHTGAVALMFVLAVISWVFFRAVSFADAFEILSRMWALPVIWPGTPGGTLAYYVAPLLAFELFARLSGRRLPWRALPRFATLNLVLFLMMSAAALTSPGGPAFIYFDF